MIRNRSNILPDAPAKRPGGKRKKRVLRDWLILGAWPEGLKLYSGKAGPPRTGFDRKAYGREYSRKRRAKLKAAKELQHAQPQENDSNGQVSS